ncbi:hypothetical protein LAZ67_23001014, partial [Cordylochernes scorpioides]
MEDEEMESPEMSQCFTSTGDNTTGDCEPRTFQRSPEPVFFLLIPSTRGTGHDNHGGVPFEHKAHDLLCRGCKASRISKKWPSELTGRSQF